MIRPRRHVQGLAAYALAPPGPEGAALLNQNEALRPPAPGVADAVARAVATAHLYPDPDWTALRAGLAGTYAVEADAILCGNGSMELIVALIAAYAGPGDEVLSTAQAYALFRTAAAMSGADYRAVPEADYRVDVDALLSGVGPATRVVAVANPGNPTGTYLPEGEIRRLRNGLRDDVLLLLDEAYGEFAGPGLPLADLVTRGDTVILRSFSKAWALAGQRVGWGVLPAAVAAEVRKLLNPNNVSLGAQAAARAALSDPDYMAETVSLTTGLRNRAAKRLRSAGYPVPESATNFLLVPFGSAEAARAADSALRAAGIVVRPMGGYGLPDCLRITVGTEDQMDAMVKVLAASDWRKT